MRQILTTLYERNGDLVMAITAEVMAAPWVRYPGDAGPYTALTNPNATTPTGSVDGSAAPAVTTNATTGNTNGGQEDTMPVSTTDGSTTAPDTPATPGGTRGRPSAVSWETRFSELTLYKAQKGTCKVSLTANPSLHRWVASQRKHYRLFTSGENSQLTQEKIDQLVSIGFEFVTERQQQIQNKQQQQRHYSWEEWLGLLQEYKSKHGHTNVPQKDDSGLGLWVAKQRQTYKLWQTGKPSAMTSERVTGLTDLGFSFESQAPKTPWRVRFAELKDYKEETGHTRVPVRGKKGNGDTSASTTYSQLGKWVEHQRTQYKLRVEGKQSAMTPERIGQLEGIGFEWIIPRAPRAGGTPQKRSADDDDGDGNSNADGSTGTDTTPNTPRLKKARPGERSIQTKKWNEKWEELKVYQQQHGHCRVAAGKGKSYSKLGKWVEHQRTQYRLMQENKASSMTNERIQRLKDLGFEFAVITPSKVALINSSATANGTATPAPQETTTTTTTATANTTGDADTEMTTPTAVENPAAATTTAETPTTTEDVEVNDAVESTDDVNAGGDDVDPEGDGVKSDDSGAEQNPSAVEDDTAAADADADMSVVEDAGLIAGVMTETTTEAAV
mmetsp:Transcript_6694/g.9453  ORF Transcript_6694/g.9453 Transcript_6694/m.9453 type:complete len:614 (-) Transcript_6694:117-1958(-)